MNISRIALPPPPFSTGMDPTHRKEYRLYSRPRLSRPKRTRKNTESEREKTLAKHLLGTATQVSRALSSSLTYLTNVFLWTSPAYCPSLSTHIYRRPSLTKHWKTRSIGEWISNDTGVWENPFSRLPHRSKKKVVLTGSI